ncbi:ABC transporter permease [Telmatospirillum siberiense]|uniref:ABC transporter permease n=1 Tax=Telmatospirillum siberiense TaxID=382514 RepID=A0A2N3PQ61_9PROT|nr:ABC transporter permease [Telmatospirillum siberiense]PKU22518.1 ABC transporter permease [Telmatospirillum siberiense]
MKRAGPWLRVVAGSASFALPTILGIVILNFLFLQLLPGDAVDVLAMRSGSATVESISALRVQTGLDQPLSGQLAAYLSRLAHFDLGVSTQYHLPVADIIAARLPDTLLLVGGALGLAVVLGLLLGSVMASLAGRWIDRMLSGLLMLIYSTPGFWIGLMMILLFSVKLGLFPSAGSATIGTRLSGLAALYDKAAHLIMPMTALSLFYTAVYARLVRATMIDVLRQDFILAARAKGLHPVTLIRRHAIRNALIPVVTVAGIHLGNLLGGAVVVETVFGWPGMGRLAFDALLSRDFPVLLGVLLLSSILVVAVNALADVLLGWLDPRILTE